MIQAIHITKRFGQKTIFNDLSLEIADGAFTVITGPSGKGKTTLLNILGGVESSDSGSLIIDGRPVQSASQKLMLHRYQAGFLFQNFALITEKTVEQNLSIAFAYQKRKNKAVAMKTAMSAVGLLGIEKKKIYQLSGGEQQRIALARLLLKNPTYIFADEPTGNLDANNRDVVLAQLKQLNKKGKTIIVVTHDLTIANDECVTQHIELSDIG